MEKKVQEIGWWIEIVTSNPSYIYYFGVFNSYYEAQWHKDSYIEDLEGEEAEIISIHIELRQPPEELTISIPIIPISA